MYLASRLSFALRGHSVTGSSCRRADRLPARAASDKDEGSYGTWTQVGGSQDHQPVTHRTRSEPGRLVDREDRLWERSDRLWERELARWDVERRAWDARETQLLQLIADLQHQMLHLARAQPQAAFAPPADVRAVPAQLSAPPPAAARDDLSHAGWEAQLPVAVQQPQQQTHAAPLPDPEEVAAVLDRGAAQGSQLEEGSLESLLYADAGATEQPPFAAEFAAAVEAVSSTDVLADWRDVLQGKNMAMRKKPAQDSAGPQATSTSPQAESPYGGSSSAREVEGLSRTNLKEASPPALSKGADDIYWVHQLHQALVEKGYYPEDEEMADWFFGDHTLSGLRMFQAGAGLPETGVCDVLTWRALLGERLPHVVAEASQQAAAAPAARSVDGQSAGSAPAATAAATASLHAGAVTEPAEARPAAAKDDGGKRAQWPILREGDGGREVHSLQVALSRAGFSCYHEEMEWWQFGDTTFSALITFQACSGLPESGVADERTWQALLGETADPAVVNTLLSGDHTDTDLTSTLTSQGVWLVGEQRWERQRA